LPSGYWCNGEFGLQCWSVHCASAASACGVSDWCCCRHPSRTFPGGDQYVRRSFHRDIFGADFGRRSVLRCQLGALTTGHRQIKSCSATASRLLRRRPCIILEREERKTKMTKRLCNGSAPRGAAARVIMVLQRTQLYRTDELLMPRCLESILCDPSGIRSSTPSSWH
jgi:hypothetical protein